MYLQNNEDYFNYNCSSINPFETQPTHFTQLQNTLLTNSYDLTIFVILHLLGDILLYYQLRQMGKIVQRKFQGIETDELQSNNQFLLFLGLFQQFGFSYLIFSYVFSRQSQALTFVLLHYQLLLSNIFLNFQAINQLKYIKQDYDHQTFLEKYGKAIVIMISIAGLLFCTITAIYKCCRQVIDAYQYYLMPWTFITNVHYIYSTIQFYNYFKSFSFNKSVKINLKISIIIIIISLVYRELYQFMRLLPQGREQMLSLKNGDPPEESNRPEWSIFIFLYFVVCDIFPRCIFLRLLQPDEMRTSIN